MVAPYQMLDSVTGGRNRPRNRVTGYGAVARNRGGYIYRRYIPPRLRPPTPPVTTVTPRGGSNE
jgi:hypothetical protein